MALVGMSAQNITISIGEQAPLFKKDTGIVNQIVAEAFARSGYTVYFDWLPAGRMIKLLEADKLDFYVTPSNTPGQQHDHVDFLSARGVFFYLKKHFPALSAKKLTDLKGMRVASIINSPLKPIFEKAGIIVDEGPIETLFLKLEANRVDFASTADVGGILTISKLFPGREEDFDFTDFAYMEIRVGFYVKDTVANPQLIAAFQSGYSEMKADGTLSRMMLAFFGPVNAKRVKVL